MEVIVKGQFIRDITSYKNKALRKAIDDVVNNLETSESLTQIKNLKKLNQYKYFYRIKISDTYRIGLRVHENKVWLARFGHRSNFYKKFP